MSNIIPNPCIHPNVLFATKSRFLSKPSIPNLLIQSENAFVAISAEDIVYASTHLSGSIIYFDNRKPLVTHLAISQLAECITTLIDVVMLDEHKLVHRKYISHVYRQNGIYVILRNGVELYEDNGIFEQKYFGTAV